MDKSMVNRIGLRYLGSVSKATHGSPTGFFSEMVFPPFNRRLS
jgi:hypothetical protein